MGQIKTQIYNNFKQPSNCFKIKNNEPPKNNIEYRNRYTKFNKDC